MPEGGLADEELLKRLSVLYSEAFVAGVAKELVEARAATSNLGAAEDDSLGEARVTEIHARTGTLWEKRFKSVRAWCMTIFVSKEWVSRLRNGGKSRRWMG